jgi:hypothetical protein
MAQKVTNLDLYGMIDTLEGVLSPQIISIDPETVEDVRARDLLRPLQKAADAVARYWRELDDYLYYTLDAGKPEEPKAEKSAKKK